MKYINKEKLIAEIETGLYNQKILAKNIGITEPTLRKFLRSEEGKEIEDLRQSKRPNIKENGRGDYLKKFNETYERKITPQREAYLTEYYKKRWAKIKAEKESKLIE